VPSLGSAYAICKDLPPSSKVPGIWSGWYRP
jgi:hypothetical protein